MALLLPTDVQTAASTVLIPLAGVLVGMSFAWIGNAQALVQTAQIERLATLSGEGIEKYVHTFQLAILIILVAVVLWALAGLGVFALPCPLTCPTWAPGFAIGVLFFVASLAVRECWHVVLGAQMLLLAQRWVARLPETKP